MTSEQAAMNIARWIIASKTLDSKRLTAKGWQLQDIANAVIAGNNTVIEEMIFQFWETLPRDVAREYDAALANTPGSPKV